MAFDAGSIQAELSISTAQANRDLAAIEARIKALEDERHEVKVAAVFDNASMSKAAKAFSDLDRQLSNEAMQRLRSSPQGSVLGALNALFSPHPVTGAPSPQQSAQQGLLGKIIQAPAPQQAAGPGSRTTGSVIQNIASAASGSTSTTDRVNVTGLPVSGGTIGTTDRVTVTGLPTSGGTISTTDKLDTSAIKSDAEQAGRDAADAANKGATDEAKRNGSGWFRGMLSGISGLAGKALGDALSGGGGGGNSKGGGGGGSFFGNLAGGIGPGVLGVGAKSAGIIGGGGALLGAVPALLGGLAPLIGAGAGAGALGLLFKGAQSSVSPLTQLSSTIQSEQAAGLGATASGAQQLAQQQAQLKQGVAGLSGPLQSIYQSEQNIGNWWQGFTASFAPKFAGPLAQVATMLQGLTGPFTQFFTSAFTVAQPLIGGLGDIVKSVLPGLAQVISASAPLIRPLLDGLGALIGNFLPGLVTLLKVAAPAVAALASVFGTLGKDLGSFFADLAPVLVPSGVVLKALFDVVGALLPILAKLAGVFATTLAPVFLQFAGVIKSLLPFLTTIGKVLAALAGAVLGDLVSAFGALAQLLTAIAPGLSAFATAFSQVFNVLENTGVFAILGDALEGLVKPLATLINALLTGLTPLLPPIIGFISQLSGLLVNALVQAITTLLPPLTTLATAVLGTIATILPVILPLLLKLAGIFTGAVVSAVSALATALAAIINAIPPSVLGAIVVGIVAIVGALKLWAIAQGIIDALLAANPIGLIVIAIAALVIAIVELVTHWNTVWTAIKDAAVAAWQAIYNTVIAPMISWFTQSIPHAWDVVASAAKTTWNAIATFFSTWWNNIVTTFKSEVSAVENALATAWNAVTTALKAAWNAIASFFTSWWNTEVAGWKNIISTVESIFSAAWTSIENTVKSVWNAISSFFTSTWNSAIASLKNNFITPFQNDIKAAWTWVVNNVFNPMETFLTKTVPGWFSTAVSDIGKFWDSVENTVKTPVAFVVNNVLNPIGQVFDTITNALGLGKPIPTLHMAAGGLLSGFGGGDIVPALLEPGEAVVDKDTTKRYAWLFKMMGVPGFATGGTVPSPGIGRGGAIGAGNPTGDPISAILGKAWDMAKLVVDITTGNITAVQNALDGLIGTGKSGAAGEIATILAAIPTTAVKDFVKWIMGEVASSGGAGGATLHPTGSGASVQALMQSMAASVGWAGAQWTALNNVEMREAGYSLTATNPSSGAYGLAQFINGPSEYAQYGGNATTAAGQITAMLNYIAQRYGTPEAAWAHELAYGWYGNGGMITEPVIGYGINSGRGYVLGERGSEMVTPIGGARGGDGTSQAAILARLDRLIDVTSQVPAATGRHVGGAISGAASSASFRNRYPRGGS